MIKGSAHMELAIKRGTNSNKKKIILANMSALVLHESCE